MSDFNEVIARVDATVSVGFARRFLRSVTLSQAQTAPLPTNPMQLLRSSRTRNFSNIGAYRAWCAHADSVGFPVGGMQMTLGVDGATLYVFHSTFVLGRPRDIAGSVPLRSLAQITFSRGITKHRITILYRDAAIIEFDCLNGRRGKAFVDAAVQRLNGPPPNAGATT